MVDIVRTIQLRSVEQFVFTAQGYNRVSFNVEADGLSTDLSQSYLKLYLSLTNIGTPENPQAPVLLTWADFNDFVANNVTVSFGNDGISYSPACLIYHARLRAKGSGEILEEINFSNVLSQTIFQLCNDFETLGSSSLLSGSSVRVVEGHGGDITTALSSIIQPRTEIHIPLKDIFGICRHTNFSLNAVGGVIMEFQLEQTQNLFQFTSSYDQRQINGSEDISNNLYQVLPEFDASGNIVFAQQPDTLDSTPLANTAIQTEPNFPPAFNKVLLDTTPQIPSLPSKLIQCPRDGWRFDGLLFQSYMSLLAGQANAPGTYYFNTIANGGRYFATTALMNACKITVGNYAKVTLLLETTQAAGETISKPFVYIAQITGLTASADPNTEAYFELDQSASYDPVNWTDYTVSIEAIEFMDSLVATPPTVATNTRIDAYEIVANNFTTANGVTSTVVSGDDLIAFQSMGMLDISFNATENTFDLYVQSTTLDGEDVVSIVTYDRTVGDGSNARKVYSNQATRMAVTGAKTYIESLVLTDPQDPTQGATITWGNFLLTSQRGYQLGYEIVPASVPTNADMSAYSLTTQTPLTDGYRMFIMNCQQPAIGALLPDYQLSYSISQFQLVLVQQTMKVPMSPAYSSWSVEVASVESDRPQYDRQFVIDSPNTFFCLGLTPDYLQTGAGSLVSTARGCAQMYYRVNNVQNTNRAIVLQDVTSDSPWSLYFDKLMTAFANSEYTLRNLTGIQTVSDSKHPVIVHPLKMYSGVVNGQYQLAPQTMGATVQVSLFGSPKSLDANVYAGPFFMFKNCIRTIGQPMGM